MRELILYINCMMNEMDIVRIVINIILLFSVFILIDLILLKFM